MHRRRAVRLGSRTGRECGLAQIDRPFAAGVVELDRRGKRAASEAEQISGHRRRKAANPGHYCKQGRSALPGCRRLFEEAASGDRWDRPEIHRLLDQLREKDSVVCLETRSPLQPSAGRSPRVSHRAASPGAEMARQHQPTNRLTYRRPVPRRPGLACRFQQIAC